MVEMITSLPKAVLKNVGASISYIGSSTELMILTLAVVGIACVLIYGLIKR